MNISRIPTLIAFLLLGLCCLSQSPLDARAGAENELLQTSQLLDSGAPDLTADRTFPPQTGAYCGPRSLVNAAARLGIPIDLGYFISRCATEQNGTTLLSLRNQALNIGLLAQGVQLTWDQLTALDAPAVLFLAPDHFAMVDPREKETLEHPGALRFYDFPKAARWAARKELEEVWHGEALIVRDILPRPKVLEYDALLFDFGVVPTRTTVTHTFHFKNVSREAVKIHGVESSCGCTVAKLSRTVFQPGESGEITVTLHLAGRRGLQRQQIKLYSGDPLSPLVILTLQGTASSPIHISTELIDLGQVVAGAKLECSLIVTDRGGGTLKIKSLGVKAKDGDSAQDLPTVAATLELTSASADRAHEEAAPGRYQTMDRGLGDGHFKLNLTATIPAAAPSGLHLAELLLSTTDKMCPEVTIPLVYDVAASRLGATPAKLVLGVLDAGGIATAKLAVNSLGGAPLGKLDFQLECGGQIIDGPLSAQVSYPESSRAEVYIVMKLDLLSSYLHQGLNAGMIRIISDRQTILVPWTCLIK